MNTVCTSDIANPEAIFSLSSEALNRAMEIIRRKEVIDGLTLKKTYNRYDFIEWRFCDGSMVEIEVLRDFNNNMKPYRVAVTEYVETTDRAGASHYKVVSYDPFEIK